MSKLKIILLIFLVAVVIIIGVSITLSFALAKPINMADPQIVLTAELGEVWAGKGDNLSLVSGEVVLQTGDSVKTGDKSRAKITFFDTQQATIDENSFVTIDEGFIDQNSALLTKVKLKLKNGQIWSRLLELLHPDASFEVEAQNVVATVRGTVFNVSSIDNNLKIVVFENSVSVASISDLSRAVTLQKNDVLTYQPKSATQKESKLEVSKISEREQNQDWVKSNLGQDIKFKEEVKAKREAIKKQIGVLPGENGYQTKILAEKLSLLTAKDKVKAGESIALKRLLEQQVLFEAGKVKMNKGLKLSGDLLNKMQRFNALNPDWKQAIRQDQDSSYQNLLDAEQLDFIKNKNSVGYSSFLMNLPNSDEILRNLEMMEKNMALIKQYLSERILLNYRRH